MSVVAEPWIENSTTSKMPGTTPARNRRPIEVSVAMRYRIIVASKAGSGSERAAGADRAGREPGGTPRRSISGTPGLPIAAAVAGLEPQIEEKIRRRKCSR